MVDIRLLLCTLKVFVRSHDFCDNELPKMNPGYVARAPVPLTMVEPMTLHGISDNARTAWPFAYDISYYSAQQEL